MLKTAIGGLLFILLLCPVMLLANELNATSAVSEASTGPLPADTPIVMDSTRDYLSAKLESWARSTDRFFGDYRNYQESNDSVVQLVATQVVGYQGPPKFDYALNVKVHLPNTEKKLQLLVETGPDKNSATGPTKIQPYPYRKSNTQGSIAAALRYEKSEAERWHFTTDGGLLMAGIASTPFARSRLRLAMPVGPWLMNVAESVFWYNTIGAGESTVLDFEHRINELFVVRSSSNATWLNDTQNFDLRQDLSLYHSLNDRAALLYQVSAIGVSRPQTQVSDYVILLLFRYRVHREWMFVELSPQQHFPRDRNFEPSSLLSMKFELLFDKSR
jgi:hypothetical protein